MNRKKVILYNPRSVFYDMPLALLSVGSALDSSKYDVRIIDARVDYKPHEILAKECEDALCLGVTVLTGSPIKDALAASRVVKKLFPKLPIVWGGWHPSLFPTQILEDEPSIDVTVQAQGEETFKELVENLSEQNSLENILGISFRDKQSSGHGSIKQNAPRPLKDINELPVVNYDLIDVEKYFRLKNQRQFDYISSTGCRFRCTFCADPFVYGRGWVAYSPQRMIDEISFWNKKFGFKDVNFQDETFFTKRQRVDEIAEQLIEKNVKISWAGTMRADQGYRMSDEEFALCKRSGLRRVLVGVESGSQEMLDWLKKDIKMEHVLATAEKCMRHKIAVNFPFIVGFPGESDESLRLSLEFSRKLSSMHRDFYTPIFYFKPYPGSQITQEVVAKGYRLPQTLDEWTKFDFAASGPWVSDEKFRLVERFKFYNKLAYRRNNFFLKPFEFAARLRLNFDFFKLPVEKFLAEKIYPAEQLS